MQWDKIVLLRIRYLQVIISKGEDNIQAHQEKSLDTLQNLVQTIFKLLSRKIFVYERVLRIRLTTWI